MRTGRKKPVSPSSFLVVGAPSDQVRMAAQLAGRKVRFVNVDLSQAKKTIAAALTAGHDWKGVIIDHHPLDHKNRVASEDQVIEVVDLVLRLSLPIATVGRVNDLENSHVHTLLCGHAEERVATQSASTDYLWGQARMHCQNYVLPQSQVAQAA